MRHLRPLSDGSSTQPARASDHALRAHLGPVLAPMRILIVDDDEAVRASLAAVLDSEGYEVHGAADGKEAVQAAIDVCPDLVLLDLNMPRMDGWAAFVKLEIVRPLVPVIIITARPHQYDHAVRLGVDAFMEKPLNIAVLLRAIRKLVYEPKERHERRIADPRFVTCHLQNQAMDEPGGAFLEPRP